MPRASVEKTISRPNFATLERPLFRHWIGSAFAGLLLSLSLPFLSACWLIDRLGSRGKALFDRNRKRQVADSTDLESSWADDEFCFELSIEKYEELIDRTARRRK
jgi:hypothetical protein